MINIFMKSLLVSFFLITTSLTFAQKSKFDSLQIVLKTLPEDTNRVNTLIELSRMPSFSDSKKIIRYADEALSLSERINYQNGKANAYFQSGYYHYKTGDVEKGFKYLLKALDIYEEMHDMNNVASIYNIIGLFYKADGETKEALDFFHRAYAIWNKSGNKPGLCRVLENIGLVYEVEHEDSLALIHFERSLALSTEIGDKGRMGATLTVLGTIYLKKNVYAKALELQNLALQYAIEACSNTLQVRVYNAMSQIYLAQGLPKEALCSAENALNIALKITSKEDIAKSYQRICKAHEKLNNYRKAYEFQTLYIALNDSIKSSDNLRSLEKLKSQHELDKKEAEVALLAFRRNVSIAALAGLLIISFLLYNRYRLVTQKRFALKKQQLAFYIQSLVEKSDTIDKISREFESFKNNNLNRDEQIEKVDRILQMNILTEQDWDNFKKSFKEIYPTFFEQLQYKYPALTVSELRLSALIKLDLSPREMATMLGISSESVKKSRYRLKKKLGLTDNETVEDLIRQMNVPD